MLPICVIAVDASSSEGPALELRAAARSVSMLAGSGLKKGGDLRRPFARVLTSCDVRLLASLHIVERIGRVACRRLERAQRRATLVDTLLGFEGEERRGTEGDPCKGAQGQSRRT